MPAGDPDDDGVGSVLFGWAKAGGFWDNFPAGVGYVLLGLIGALVTAYLFLGDFLPSMGGKADYDASKAELDEFKQRRDKLLIDREKDAAGTGETSAEQRAIRDALYDDHERTIARLEARLARDRRGMYLTGFPMYLILGGAFAVLFATNALQALLVGFGWTAVADRAGMKREVDARQDKKALQIKELEDAALKERKKAEAAVARAAELEARVKPLTDEIKARDQLVDVLVSQVQQQPDSSGGGS
ncbi:MAG: hypothetical protein M3323_08675 [Actinomycetota bacterium]|nr:hypothetical protein [Actinomycetota bacterium]